MCQEGPVCLSVTKWLFKREGTGTGTETGTVIKSARCRSARVVHSVVALALFSAAIQRPRQQAAVGTHA